MSHVKGGLSPEAYKVLRAQEAEQQKMAQATDPRHTMSRGDCMREFVGLRLFQAISANHQQALAELLNRTDLIMERMGMTGDEVNQHAQFKILQQKVTEFRCKSGHMTKCDENETVASAMGKKVKCGECDEMVEIVPADLFQPKQPPAPPSPEVPTKEEFKAQLKEELEETAPAPEAKDEVFSETQPSSIVLTDL